MKEQLCYSVAELVLISNGNADLQILIMKLDGRMVYHTKPEVGHLKKLSATIMNYRINTNFTYWNFTSSKNLFLFLFKKIPVSKICQHT
jgi:hypothetical protein